MLDMVHTQRIDRAREVWELVGQMPDAAGDADYARRMHRRPFDYYAARIRKLGISGGRVLDAGCGTGTWSFALSVAFDEVVGIDVSAERIAAAKWLADAADVPGVEFRAGSVLNCGLRDASVDAVFCYGVLISAVPVDEALKEFRRVLKPGGVLYVCLNGIGWSYFLRDERGKDDPKIAEMGRQGIYNTLVRSLPDHEFSAIVARGQEYARESLNLLGRTVAGASRVLEQASVTLGNRLKSAQFYSPTAKAGAELEGWIRYLSPPAMPPCRLAQIVPMILEECGESYLIQLATDVAQIADGNQNGFSHANAGRGYTPDEVQAICEGAGLIDFQWATEGMLAGANVADPPAPIHEGYLGPNLRVWEFLAFRPDNTLGQHIQPDWFRENAREAARLSYSAAARTPIVTNVDAATVPRGWVKEARRRANAAGGDRLIGALAEKLCAGAACDEESVARLVHFVQDALVHHPIVQPFVFNGAAVTDPATLLFIGIGRCGASAPLLAALCTAAGYRARVERVPGHVFTIADVGGAEVLLEADVFKKGILLRGADGRLLRHADMLKNPRSMDGLPDLYVWWIRHFQNALDLWGRRPYGYIEAEGSTRIYSSYFEPGAELRYKPKAPTLVVERIGRAVRVSWDNATPADGAQVEYRVAIRKTSRNWGYDEEPDTIESIVSPPVPEYERWVDGNAAIELDWPEPGYVDVTPRLKQRPDVFCWSSNESHVKAASGAGRS